MPEKIRMLHLLFRWMSVRLFVHYSVLLFRPLLKDSWQIEKISYSFYVNDTRVGGKELKKKLLPPNLAHLGLQSMKLHFVIGDLPLV